MWAAGSWAQAMSLQAAPQAAPAALKRLAEHVDDVWHAAGDTSADYNWYTKRALLAGVYTSTELYMLTGGLTNFPRSSLAPLPSFRGGCASMHSKRGGKGP